ncbi:MAG: hypothetical protein NVSMB51_00250 [Solirubrobacteraceae bacterium]
MGWALAERPDAGLHHEPRTAILMDVRGQGSGDAFPAADDASSARPPLLGRERELRELESAAQAACGGRGGCCLIVGEPGIGKTRLASELEQALGEQMRSAWGRCWENSGAPPFWPWAAVVRSLATQLDDAELAARLDGGEQWLAPLIPDLAHRLAAGRTAAPLDSDHARFAVLDALRAFLQACALDRPLLVLLDDIHVADKLSLLALRHLVRELGDSQILVVATMRDQQAEEDAAALLAEIAAVGAVIRLGGLDADDLARLIEYRSGSTPPAALLRSVQSASGGNPFFTDETIRLLIAEGGGLRPETLPLPESVRSLVRRRLEMLPAASREVLRIGAVIGQRFAMATVQRIAGGDGARLLEGLDAARAAGLVITPLDSPASIRFSHGLVREAIYADLDAAERVALHHAVGQALEQRYAGIVEPHLAELAHHFTVAASGGVDVAKAIDYARRAGLAALAAHAYEQASRLLGQTLELIEHEPPDPVRRGALLVALGRAYVRRGDPRSRSTLLEAAAGARALDDAELFAEVALAFGSFALSPGNVDAELIELLEEGIARTSERSVRARLLSRLALALYWAPEAAARREQLVERAVALAREVDDREALAVVLGHAVLALRGPDTAEQELVWCREALAIPGLDAQLAVTILSARIDRLLESSDLAEADAAIEALARVAAEQREPRGLAFAPVQRARRALIDGRFAEAQQLMEQALRIGAGQQDSTIPVVMAGQRFVMRWLQGRPDESEAELRALVSALPMMHVWTQALATTMADRDKAEARNLFERHARGGFADVPRDALWLITLSLAAEACWKLADQDSAAVLTRLLEPYRHRTAVSPSAGYTAPVARFLGLLAATLGERERAGALLREALAAATACGARPVQAMILLDLATVLGTPKYAGEAASLARELGSLGVFERAEALAQSAPAAAAERTLVREGEVWTLARAGRPPIRVRDAKGVRHLAALLANPGVEFAAIELAREADGARGGQRAAAAGLHANGAGSAGPALDAEAKRAYRARVEDLREEVMEAEEFNDPERAARAREELAFIAAELSAAMGLGGRDRPQGSDVERARVNVTRALRTAIKRITQLDPELGGELDRRVRTGTFCSLQPDPRQPSAWRVDAGR